MVEIHLATRWIDAEDRAHVFLLTDLLTAYHREFPDLPSRWIDIGIMDTNPDNEDPEWDRVTLRIMPFENWYPFGQWCGRLGVQVGAKKKVVDGSKVWWPSVIEINADSDNEMLFMSTMIHR